MQKISVGDFAANYKREYPQYQNVNDDEIVKQYLASHPDDRDKIDSATLLDNVVTGGLRIGGAIAGGVAGSFVTPLAGTIAGGAVGAGLGEGAAEMWEKARGLRSSYSPAQIATQTALGAVPVKGLAAGAGFLKSAAVHGAQGAGMGAVSTAATDLAEHGKLPAWQDIAKGAAMGGVMGGAIGGFGARAKKPAPTPSVIPEMEALRVAQEEALAGASPSLATRVKATPGHLRTQYLDQADPLRQYEKQLEKTKGFAFRRGERPSDVFDRNVGGAGGSLENYEDALGAIRDSGARLGIQQPLNDYLSLSGFAHAARSLERKALKEMADPDLKIKSEGIQRMAQLINGELLPQQLTMPKVTQRLQALEQSMSPDQWRQVQAHGKQVFDLSRNTLTSLHGEGIVSTKAYNHLTNSGNDYIPMLRIMGDEAEAGSKFGALDLKSQHVLYNLEGSEKDTLDPFAAMLTRGQDAIKHRQKNQMARAVADLHQIDPTNFRQLRAKESVPKGFGEMGYYENGQQIRFMAPEAIANIYNNPPKGGTMPGIAVLRATQTASQAMMTSLNPAFSLANVVRDIYSTRVLSPLQTRTQFQDPRTWIKGPADLARFIGEWGIAWKQAMQKSPEYRHMLEAGGSYSTMQKTLTPQTFLNKGTTPTTGRKVLDGMAKFSSWNEEATKLATFKRAIKAGMSDNEAATITRKVGGSPDFGVRGRKSTDANAIFMFFNAQMQGVNRNIQHIVKDPKRLGQLAGSAMVATFANDARNRAFLDPDGTPSIDRVSDQEKNANWIIMRNETYTTSEGVTKRRFFKIPKDHIAKLIHNPMEEMVNALYNVVGQKESAGKGAAQVALEFAGNALPGSFNLKPGAITDGLIRGVVSSANPLLKTPAEWATNKDTYRNIPIEAKRLQGVQVPERYTSTTSPTMRGVSKLLEGAGGLATAIGASPQQLQHALANFAPGPGEMTLSALDLAAGKNFLPNRGALQGDEKLSRMPVLGPIIRRVVGSSLDQLGADQNQKFYELVAKGDAAAKTLKLLQGRSPTEARQFAQANLPILALNKQLTAVVQQLAQLRKRKESIMQGSNPNAGEELRRIGGMEKTLMATIAKKIVAPVAK